MATYINFKGMKIGSLFGYRNERGFIPEKLKDKEVKSCVHSFKMYSGFKESYKYCTKCDKKENI